jgi:hypothetical protein
VQRLGSARGTSLTGRVVGPTQRAEEVQKKKADSKKKKKLLSWIAGNGRYASTTAGRQSRRATSGDLIPSVR